MPMPKATMYENNFAAARKHQVRLSGKISPVKPETESHAMNQPAHQQLRLHPFASDPLHIGRPLLRRQPIHRNVSAELPDI